MVGNIGTVWGDDSLPSEHFREFLTSINTTRMASGGILCFAGKDEHPSLPQNCLTIRNFDTESVCQVSGFAYFHVQHLTIQTNKTKINQE